MILYTAGCRGILLHGVPSAYSRGRASSAIAATSTRQLAVAPSHALRTGSADPSQEALLRQHLEAVRRPHVSRTARYLRFALLPILAVAVGFVAAPTKRDFGQFSCIPCTRRFS